MKRFWTTAAVAQENDRFAIRLDGRPMRLPGGPLLRLQSRALADAIAAEWQATGDTLTAEDVPLTRIAGTAQDRVAPDPTPTVDALAAYGATDLLCYRADAPAALVARQEAVWQPWLDWAADTMGARLHPVCGVIHRTQDAGALLTLREAVQARPTFVLAGLGILVPALGSLVLGLAVADGALDAEGAHAAACLDELFQEEKWGADREALARRRHVAADIAAAARFMRLSAGASTPAVLG